ncbi:MAG: sarcosine oxidase subunit gamma family protein [Steroidobacterales bacterium]
MSVPDPRAGPGAAAGLRLGGCLTDIVELATLRARASQFETLAGERGLQLPRLGHVVRAGDQLVLCVRPQRHLLLAPAANPGVTAGDWQAAGAGVGTAVDLSSGLTALHLAGPAAREVLVRSCRLDLDPHAFPVGAAAATVIAQVPAILAALSSGLLLLTPASSAAHVRGWLAERAQPFGFMPQPDVTVAALLSGDQCT